MNKTIVIFTAMVIAAAIGSVLYPTYQKAKKPNLSERSSGESEVAITKPIEKKHAIKPSVSEENDNKEINLPDEERVSIKEATLTNDTSVFEKAIEDIELPDSVDTLALNELEILEERITKFFDENDVITRINEDLMDEEDKIQVSHLIRKATEIRSRAFDLRADDLGQQLVQIKLDVANGDIPMPQPLTYSEIQQVEDIALQEYEELKRQERLRIQIQEEALNEEEQLLN